MNQLLLTIGLCLLATLGTLGVHPPIAVRFHHLHYRVPDPGDALGDAAEAFEGTRTILQGLGVGVRVGTQYVLFDRQSGTDPRSRRRSAPDAYLQAARWLSGEGIGVAPASLAETAVARGWSEGTLDHVGFAASDPALVLAAIKAKPSTANADRARFTIAAGLGVEIVRDTTLPDVWWCPMHVDVRSPTGGSCPICSMALVRIPPPRVGEYRLDVSLLPRPGGGSSGLTMVVRDPDTGERVSRFIEVHERQLHLFIISRDLTRFAHVHPRRREDGTFELQHDMAAGEYMLIADFLPADGTAQLVQRAVVTPGYAGPLFAAAALPTPSASPQEQVAGGLRIRLESDALRPRRESLLRFLLSDADSGLPVTDLEPYLGAAGHMLIVNSDLSSAIHGHPEATRTSGHVVTFGSVFPAPGAYKLWVQFQRRGQVVTASFVVTIQEL